ncbi:MAG: LytR/AlgR family response regulator transcription factor [Aquabacterium sp.]
MSIRAIAVDDEQLALQRVRWLLQDEPDVTLVAECDDAPLALEVIARERPDLLFLDVQMPEMNGFELLHRLGTSDLPVVIFTTAHDKHAVQAFEAHALDYLLKPYKAERFKAALARARDQLAQRRLGHAARDLRALLDASTSSPLPLPTFLKRITIKDNGRMVVVDTKNIDCLESAGNYVGVQVGSRTHILRETLHALEAQLDPAQFVRISRGAIVNLERIAELQPTAQGGHVAVMRDDRRLPMTRGLKELEQRLKYS